MPRGDRSIVLRHLNTLFSVRMIGDLTDSHLLERFTSHMDETAELAFRGAGRAPRADGAARLPRRASRRPTMPSRRRS